MSNIRIGYGFDIHRFDENRPLILGGVTIPFKVGLVGHSDADVLIHAVCDALLGAAALGDIGNHFPDDDPRYKDADSRELLRECRKLVEENGFDIGNVDVTVVAQKPKLAPYIEEMRNNLASDLDIAIGSVSIKATTSENIGFEGREEGISATSVILIFK